MELLPKSVGAVLPSLYANEAEGLNAVALVKFFTPDSNWIWYASEFDQQGTFFGLVIGFQPKFGYFTLSELQAVRGPLGLPIERDLHFEPQSFAKLRDHYRSRGGRDSQKRLQRNGRRIPAAAVFRAGRRLWPYAMMIPRTYEQRSPAANGSLFRRPSRGLRP